jgi:hypothetical protein
MGSVPFDVCAQVATQDEALIVASSWITRVIGQEGKWGDSDHAQVLQIEPFTRDSRILGYFCRVEPVGFVVVSLYKELVPIKAYSAKSNLDPDVDGGMTSLVKTEMEAILDALEPSSGSVKATSPSVLEVDYRPAWDLLMGISSAPDPQGSLQLASNYQGGQSPLLTSSWDQGEPYNSLCPASDSECVFGAVHKTHVGCVATAAAQIMKYWNWPPYGQGSHSYRWDGDDTCPDSTTNAGGKALIAAFSDSYDWLRMPDTLTEESDAGMINATAELCYEIGVAIEMDYGLWRSSGDILDPNGADMLDAYVDYFRYSNERAAGTHSDNAAMWFDVIKDELNANRPLQYTTVGHSMVLDGWRQEKIAGVSIQQYHMNYGWAGRIPSPSDPCYCSEWTDHANSNAWYTLNELPCSDLDQEAICVRIYPAQALGAQLQSKTYDRESFNYRYFDQDATGQNVTFAAGQRLQFLPKVSVRCASGSIQFRATTADNTELFSIQGTRDARIKMVAESIIVLYAGGSLRFYGTR